MYARRLLSFAASLMLATPVAIAQAQTKFLISCENFVAKSRHAVDQVRAGSRRCARRMPVNCLADATREHRRGERLLEKLDVVL